MAKGGKREGAGRPKGALSRPQFRDFVTEKEAKNWLESLRERIDNDPKLLIWALDQYFGKAIQSVEADLTSKGEKLNINDEQYKQLVRTAAKRVLDDKSSA